MNSNICVHEYIWCTIKRDNVLPNRRVFLVVLSCNMQKLTVCLLDNYMYFSCKQTFIKARGNPLSSPLPFIAICCLDQWLQACTTSFAWDCCLVLTVVPLNTSCMFCSCSLMHTTTIQWTGLLDWTIALTKTASEWRLNRTVKLKHSDYILALHNSCCKARL